MFGPVAIFCFTLIPIISTIERQKKRDIIREKSRKSDVWIRKMQM